MGMVKYNKKSDPIDLIIRNYDLALSAVKKADNNWGKNQSILDLIMAEKIIVSLNRTCPVVLSDLKKMYQILIRLLLDAQNGEREALKKFESIIVELRNTWIEGRKDLFEK